MPFQSKAQQGYMFMHHPKIAREFAKETQNFKALPEHVQKKFNGGWVAHLDSIAGCDLEGDMHHHGVQMKMPSGVGAYSKGGEIGPHHQGGGDCPLCGFIHKLGPGEHPQGVSPGTYHHEEGSGVPIYAKGGTVETTGQHPKSHCPACGYAHGGVLHHGGHSGLIADHAPQPRHPSGVPTYAGGGSVLPAEYRHPHMARGGEVEYGEMPQDPYSRSPGPLTSGQYQQTDQGSGWNDLQDEQGYPSGVRGYDKGGAVGEGVGHYPFTDQQGTPSAVQLYDAGGQVISGHHVHVGECPACGFHHASLCGMAHGGEIGNLPEGDEPDEDEDEGYPSNLEESVNDPGEERARYAFAIFRKFGGAR